MMKRKLEHLLKPHNERGRDGFGKLIRNRGIQIMLGAVALAQFTAIAGGEQGSDTQVSLLRAVAPVTVTPDAAEGVQVASAWSAAALELKSEELADRYKAEGYPLTEKIAQEIHEAAVEHDIDPAVAFGLVRAESSFRNTATSVVGAVGLTQLMPATARWMEPGVTRSELRDTGTNLRIGFKYLRYLLDKYEGDENLALLAYNRGPGTVDRALKRGMDPDNGYAAFVRGDEDHGHTLFTR